MDDFERELTRMMREGRTHIPLEPGQRTRLYDGIRARRRSRALVRAGGSALAVAGLSIGLALLPHLGSGSPPADLPLPATGSTAPGASGSPPCPRPAPGRARPCRPPTPPSPCPRHLTAGDHGAGHDGTGDGGPRHDPPRHEGTTRVDGNRDRHPRHGQHADLSPADRMTPDPPVSPVFPA